MTLAQTLKAWRGTASQAVAAATLGVSLRTYSHWEQGRNPDPSTLALLLRLIKLVKAGDNATTHGHARQ